MTPAEAYGASGLEILEHDGTTIRAAIKTESGTVFVIADVFRIENRLMIDGVHVDGEGLSLKRIRELALVFGEVEDVEEVVIQGGRRTSGAHPGSIPSAIRVRIKR